MVMQGSVPNPKIFGRTFLHYYVYSFKLRDQRSGSKCDSIFHAFKVDQMNTRIFWGRSGKN